MKDYDMEFHGPIYQLVRVKNATYKVMHSQM